MNLWLQSFKGAARFLAACGVLALFGCGPAWAACAPDPAASQSLTVNDVNCIVRQAVEVSGAQGQSQMTVAVTDRVGNVLAVYRTGAASNVTITSGTGVAGGLEGVGTTSLGGADVAALAAISKAVTGAYLSSSGNAFSTRTASFIVQEHFPPLRPKVVNSPSGPLFGVQFSQLQCGDFVSKGGTLGVGPRASPLGLSADPGGFPLYKNGVVVGGIGVIAGANSTYGLDVDASPRNLDLDVEEIIAQSASAGFVAPAAIRADRISLGGIVARYSDSDARLNTPPAAGGASPSGGSFVSVTGFFTDVSSRAGQQYGVASSGYRAGTGSFSNYFVLDNGSGTQRNAPVASGFPTTGANGGMTSTEVTNLLLNALNVARSARAQIRKPDGSFAQVTVSVVDASGNILGMARTPDAPIFGTDVSLQKARTAVFFSRSTAAGRLAAAGQSPYVVDTQSFFSNASALANGRAISARAVGNMARPFFPDGIDGQPRGPLSKGVNWSPFNVGLQLDLVSSRILNSAVSQCTTASIGINNGIQIFPGGVPIYRGNLIVGGIGVSGDGVDQDDMIATLGLARTAGLNHAPAAIRVNGLKYFQCPQAPFLNSNQQNVCNGL